MKVKISKSQKAGSFYKINCNECPKLYCSQNLRAHVKDYCLK